MNIKLRYIAAALALIGLLDSIYLSWMKISNNQAMCIKGLGDCWSVNTSRYATIYGIPIALLGAGAYLAILALLWMESRGEFWENNSPIGVFGLSLVGVLYSAYLTYIEIAVLKAICPFCVLSAVVLTGLWVISIIRLGNYSGKAETTTESE